MDKLLKKIEKLEIVIKPNFNYDLKKEFELISHKLEPEEIKFLEKDYAHFFKIGKNLVLNTLCGGILFLKLPEPIEKIKIQSVKDSKCFSISVVFKFEKRLDENIKYKPNVGKIESVEWKTEQIFPNFFMYSELIQSCLLLIIGKVVRMICEYGKINFANMKIKNNFPLELYINNKLIYILVIKGE